MVMFDIAEVELNTGLYSGEDDGPRHAVRPAEIRAGYTAPHGGALGTAEVESCRGDQSTDADCRPVRARRLCGFLEGEVAELWN